MSGVRVEELGKLDSVCCNYSGIVHRFPSINLSYTNAMHFERLQKKMCIQAFWKRVGVGVGSRGQKESKN